MKKNIIAKIGAAAVVLTMVTTSLVGGTFAKYTSTVSGDVKASVAAWKIAFKNGDTDITSNESVEISLNNMDNAVKDGKIAPGSYGEIKLTIDGSGTEVSYDYKVVADLEQLSGIPIKFYTDGKHGTELTPTGNTLTLADTTSVDKDALDKINFVTIYWAWNATGKTETTEIDTADTAAGKDPKSGTITLTMTATQKTDIQENTPAK